MGSERIISAVTTWQTPQEFAGKTLRKKKKKIQRRSIIALWQAIMYSRFRWQEKLSEDEYEVLRTFGRRTSEFGYLILQWTLDNWIFFAQQSVREAGEYPSIPNVTFFSTHQAVAFNLWRITYEAAFDDADEILQWCMNDLAIAFNDGEAALFRNIAPLLEEKGLLKRNPQGRWEVCSHVFDSKTEIYDKYLSDADFRNLLRNAAAG